MPHESRGQVKSLASSSAAAFGPNSRANWRTLVSRLARALFAPPGSAMIPRCWVLGRRAHVSSEVPRERESPDPPWSWAGKMMADADLESAQPAPRLPRATAGPTPDPPPNLRCAFHFGCKKLPCRFGIAYCGFGCEAEDNGEMERVGAVSKGFFELPVSAQPFEGGDLAVECRGDPGAAGRGCCQCCLAVDDHVGVGGGWPLDASVVQPLDQGLVGEFVERAGPAGDSQTTVAKVEVGQAQGTDGAYACGVHGGKGENQSVGGTGGGGDRSLDVACGERLVHLACLFVAADAAGGVSEYRAVLLAEAEQRA